MKTRLSPLALFILFLLVSLSLVASAHDKTFQWLTPAWPWVPAEVAVARQSRLISASRSTRLSKNSKSLGHQRPPAIIACCPSLCRYSNNERTSKTKLKDLTVNPPSIHVHKVGCPKAED